MKALIRWAVNNSPAMNVLMLAMLLVGTASLIIMRREVFPEFELDVLLVTVPYPGASPDEVEEGICQKIEEAVQAVDGIKKQTSVAREGMGFVVLELDASVKDVQKVLNEVRSEIDQIPSFPELAEDPDVKQITFRVLAIRVSVLGPDTDDPTAELALREVAEQVRDELLQMQPVPPKSLARRLLAQVIPQSTNAVISSANIVGAKPYQIDVEIAEDTLRRHGLSLSQVAQIIRRENLELPGGSMKTASEEVLLRGKDKRSLGTEIENIQVLTQPNGDVLTVGDLGTVRDGFDDTTSIQRIDGRPGLVVSVDRTSSEDLFAVVNAVHHYVATKKLPPGYELRTWNDQSVDVRDRLNMLVRNGVSGLVLVFLVLAVFLDLRLAFWVALGIPVAILGSGGVLIYAGQTLNMLSMFAFLMALGIVVDDAIVIGENVFQHRQAGKSFVQAAIDGTHEVLPSVAASVATTIVAFVPLMFVSGVMGKFIAVMPLAVIAMLIISLLESTFVLPCHLAHHDNLFFRLIGYAFYPLKFLVTFSHWLNDRSSRMLETVVERIYLPTLGWSLRNPAIILSAAAGLLIVAAGFVRSGITPFIVFPKLDNRIIEAAVKYPDGTPSAVTDAATQRLEQAFLEINARYAEQGTPLLMTRHRSVGQMNAGEPGPTESLSGAHLGAVTIELVAPSDREVVSQTVLDQWRAAAGEFPGAESVSFRSPSFGPSATPIEFKLLADAKHFDELEAAVEQTKEKLRSYDGVFDVEDDSRPGKWEGQLKINERSRALGIPLAELAETVRSSYYGEEVMRLQRGRHEVKLMVRYPRADRYSQASLSDIRIRTGDGAETPLTELASVDYRRGYSEINRIDQMRSITISADVDESRAVTRDIVADLKQEGGFIDRLLAEHPGLRVRWEGQQEQTQDSMQSLFVGFIVAVLVMYVLLTIEFRSYLQPLLILAIIPFGAIGAVAGHAIMGLPLTLFSMFGLVALTGVVVNDSIVLIDFINVHSRDGLPLLDSLLEAGRRRFRPVLLTSVTTVAGLVPLLIEPSFQAQVLIPMATSLCFGLVLATALVLFLVPTLYLVYAKTVRQGPVDESDDGASYELHHRSDLPLENVDIGRPARESLPA